MRPSAALFNRNPRAEIGSQYPLRTCIHRSLRGMRLRGQWTFSSVVWLRPSVAERCSMFNRNPRAEIGSRVSTSHMHPPISARDALAGPVDIFPGQHREAHASRSPFFAGPGVSGRFFRSFLRPCFSRKSLADATNPNRPRSSKGPIQLADVTKKTGIQFVHTDGSSGRRFIIEPMSAGLALFDYDNDGWIDIYFLNGAPLPGTKVTTPPKTASIATTETGRLPTSRMKRAWVTPALAWEWPRPTMTMTATLIST